MQGEYKGRFTGRQQAGLEPDKMRRQLQGAGWYELEVRHPQQIEVEQKTTSEARGKG